MLAFATQERKMAGSHQNARIICGNSPVAALCLKLLSTCPALPRSSCCYKICTGKSNMVIYMDLLGSQRAEQESHNISHNIRKKSTLT